MIPGDPIPKARARTVKGHTYTPEHVVAAEAAVGWAVKAAAAKAGVSLRDRQGQYTILASFYRKNQRVCDLDNLLKLVMDACNGIVWDDDSQVNEIHAKVERGSPNPRTVLMIRRNP